MPARSAFSSAATVVKDSRLICPTWAAPPPSYFSFSTSSTLPAVEKDLSVYGPLTVFHSGSLA
ncbi:hypothetical protein SVIOM342S_02035 [Streptomyces violaceorubidus]